MLIVPIFASENLDEKGGLLAVRYIEGDLDEYERLFENWTNKEWIRKYLERNETWLASDFFKSHTKEAIVTAIEKEAVFLDDFFIRVYEEGFGANCSVLQHIFKPLDNREYRLYALQQQKGKATGRRFNTAFLRIYAIRLHENLFIITGGAIKLTQSMSEHPDTLEELNKLKKAVAFLRDNGINTSDDLIYYYDNLE